MFPLFIDYFLILWQKNPTKTKKTGCSRIILYFLCLSPEMTISLGTCLYSPQSCLQIVFTNENYMIRIHLFLNFSIGILTNDKNSSQVNIFSSVQFSCSVVSDSLWPHEPWHAKPPCPSPTPGIYPNLMSIELVMPSNHLILCHPLLLLPSIFPSIRFFSNESALHIRWSKY